MKHKLLKRAGSAFGALLLIIGQLMLPINIGLTNTASAAGNELPVWCKTTGSGWQVQLSANGDGKDGPLTIPVAGYNMVNGQVVAPNRSDKILADACVKQYTVTAPTQVVVCGPNNDTVTAGAHMTMSPSPISWSNNTASVTFTADGAYQFMTSAGVYSQTQTVTYTDAATVCPLIVITAPTITPTVICGANNDTVILPTGHFTVTTDSDWVNGQRTIALTANTGYTFAGGLTTTITLTDSNTDCIVEAPTVTPAVVCGPNNDTYVTSTGDYTVTSTGWVNGKNTFTFTANAGFAFSTGATYTVTLTDENTPCVIDNPIVTPADVCGANNDTYTANTGNFSLTTDTGWSNGSRTLTFTANQGYIFAGGATFTVTLTDTATPCPVAIPAAPQPTDPCGLNNATWALPADTNSIHWSITNGHLYANTKDGYIFTDNTTSHDYGTAPDSGALCLADTPEVAVVAQCGPTNNDTVMVTGGSHYTYTVTRDGTTITVTITADADYGFGDGTTKFTRTFTDQMERCSTNLPATLASTDPCDNLHSVNNPIWLVTPEDTDYYTWTLNNDGSYTVTAKAGYILNIDGVGLKLSYTYNLPLNNPNNVCYTTVTAPAAPVTVYTCGDTAAATWTLPKNTEEYTWSIMDGELVVTANDGYVLNDDGALVTEINFGTAPDATVYKPCPATYSTLYTYNDSCGTVNDSLTLPKNTEHVTYSYKAVDGYYVVTISAAEGFYLEEIDGQFVTQGTYKVKIGDYDPSLVCSVGVGNVKPPVVTTTAPVAQELPHTGANDNSYLTLFGLVASLATYGAVLLLQRRNAQ